MKQSSVSLSCPMPIMDHDTIQLAHGAGGKLSANLIESMFLPRFGNNILNSLEDQAVVPFHSGHLAISTDTFVVDPLFFPGGNIGDLAVNGTVNDIAMAGAKPLYLTAGFVLEEGLNMESLHRILLAMEQAAGKAGVKIITGDTKVVNHGQCDKIFINTTGIGVVPDNLHISASLLKPGDQLILSGTIADHGMAVMTSREGLSFQNRVHSDTAALNDLVKKMLEISPNIHALRDPTRGGVATTLNEFAASSNIGILIFEENIPVMPDVKAACELLGIDPLTVANEGKLIAAVPGQKATEILNAMRNCQYGEDAVILGEVVADHPGLVVMKTLFGANRIIDMPLGEQLPRIC